MILSGECWAKTDSALTGTSNQFNNLQSQLVKGKALTISSTSIDGKLEDPAFVYRDGINLVFKNSKYKHIIGKNIGKYWVKVAGKHIYIFTWIKFLYGNKDGKENQYIQGKTLFVTVSSDGGKSFNDRVIVNRSDGVLPDIDIVADENGHISVVYADERYPGHQVFVNSSLDGGKTWLKKDFMLSHADKVDGKYKKSTAYSPGIGRVGTKIVAIWQELTFAKDKTITKFLSKESNDNGLTWGNEKTIFQEENLPSTEIESFSFNNEMYLFAAITKKDMKGLKVFSLKDKQVNWKNINGVAPNSDKAKLVSYIKASANKENLYVTYITVNNLNIWHTEFAQLNRKNNAWHKDSIQLDRSADGSADEIKSGYQDVAVLDDGTIIAAWEDYRGILSAVFLNYSTNNGETWLAEPLPLIKVGSELASMPFIRHEGNKFNIFYNHADLPEGKKPTISTLFAQLKSPKSFNEDEYKKLFPDWKKPSEKESRQVIIKKSKEVLEARVKQDWETEWKHLDPLYRNLYSKSSWLRTRGQILFKDYKINDVQFLRGVYAHAIGEVTFDFGTELEGNIKDIPEKEKKNKKQALNLRWGWFYDDWYLIPFTGFENPHIP